MLSSHLIQTVSILVRSLGYSHIQNALYFFSFSWKNWLQTCETYLFNSWKYFVARKMMRNDGKAHGKPKGQNHRICWDSSNACNYVFWYVQWQHTLSEREVKKEYEKHVAKHPNLRNEIRASDRMNGRASHFCDTNFWKIESHSHNLFKRIPSSFLFECYLIPSITIMFYIYLYIYSFVCVLVSMVQTLFVSRRFEQNKTPKKKNLDKVRCDALLMPNSFQLRTKDELRKHF